MTDITQLEESYRAGLESGKAFTVTFDGTTYAASPAEPNAIYGLPHFYVGPERIGAWTDGSFTVSSEQASRWMRILSSNWIEDES
jgi:hypothetical protein